MLRTLDRYLLRSFVSNYVLSLFVLISLYVVLDLFVNLDEFTKDNKGFVEAILDIFDYYIYNVPVYFSQLSGVIATFAACLTLARMQRLNEITAFLASGTSTYRLAAPIVVAGLVMNLLLVANYEVILPGIAPKLARTRDDVEGAKVHEVWFVRDGENRLISAKQFSPKEQRIGKLLVMELSPDPGDKGALRDVVLADKADWNQEKRGWDLTNGLRFSVAAQGEGVFGRNWMVKERVAFYDSTLVPDDIKLRQTTQWLAFLSTSQLNALAEHGEVDRLRVAQIKHRRFTEPIGNMLLLLLGLPFFMNRLPVSILTQGGKALLMCAICFLVTFGGQQVAGTLDVSPALPAWIPILIFAPVAVLVLDNVKT